MEEFGTVVVGAGLAGLSAARKLARGGKRVLVLEAQDRVGGRLLTAHERSLELPVELGAEFVHGRPRDLLDLIAEAGLHTLELGGDDFCWEENRLLRCNENEAFEAIAGMEQYEGPDLSFAAYLAGKSLSPRAHDRVLRYVEGFNAADANEISVQALIQQQKAEDAIEGDRLFRIREGYSALADFLCREAEAAGCVVRLNSPVAEVRWDTGWVALTTSGGETFRAERAVIAVPLGVLHAGAIRFLPQPGSVLEAADKLAMGTVQRMVLTFGARFWALSPDYARLGFLFPESDASSTWWTPFPSPAPMLTSWLGGPRAEGMGNEEVILASRLEQLSRFFSLPIAQLRENLRSWHMHDWRSDPWTRGAYCYARVGGADASQRLAQPVADTLFFAGEHTDITGHWGTVHGAYRSGLRAAEQVLAKREAQVSR